VLIRKRVTAAAVGLAVIVAATLAPVLVHALSRPAPIAPRYHVTVFPPGPGAPKELTERRCCSPAGSSRRWHRRTPATSG
jgi:hypothetical protein